MSVLAIKTGRYEKYWTEGEKNVLVTRWKGKSVVVPRKKSSKAVLHLHSKISKVPRVLNLLGLFSVLELQKFKLCCDNIHKYMYCICDPLYVVHILVSLSRGKISLNLVQFFFFFLIRENIILLQKYLHVLVFSVWTCTKYNMLWKKFTIKFC